MTKDAVALDRTSLSVGDIVYLVAKGKDAISGEDFAAICRMACEAYDLRALLREVYEQHGPGARGGSAKEPPEVYASLSKEEIDRDWDFPERHAMQRIARALCVRP